MIDNVGNIIDKWGDLVFKNFLLDQTGEIPIVFRNGLLRKGSGSSLGKLMSEIEKENDDEIEEMLWGAFEEEEKGNTSVDSAMGDTPSNYNIPNQRFDSSLPKNHAPLNKYNEEDEDMYEDDSNGEMEEVMTEGGKKITWKKWWLKKKQPGRLNETDILLAKAYGGKPKPKGKDMSWISSRAKMPPMNNRLFDEDWNNWSWWNDASADEMK